MNENNINYDALIEKGILTSQNEISQDKINLRVFNKDFIQDNLRFIYNPDDDIEPFAILGDDNDILEKEIAALENEVGSNEEGKETGLYAQLKSNRMLYMEVKAAYEQVASSLDKQLTEKATGRTNSIKYNLEKFGEPNYNKTKLESDIRDVMSSTYLPLDDAKKFEYEQLLTERIKPTIPALPALSLQFEQFCSQSEELLSKEIGASDKITELIHDITLNEWVKKGCELHKGSRATCAFCGGTISDERWAVLYRHYDEESKILEDKIDCLIKQIEIEIKSVEGGFKVDKNLFYSKYQGAIEQLSQSYSVAANKYAVQLDLIIEQLSRRKNTITVSLPFVRPMNYSEELYTIWANYEELRNQSNDFSSRLNKEQTKAKGP